jgi:hypothetical protein
MKADDLSTVSQYLIGPFLIGTGPGHWYARIRGWYGVRIKDTRRARLHFSERNGYRGRRIGPYLVRLLTPNS